MNVASPLSIFTLSVSLLTASSYTTSSYADIEDTVVYTTPPTTPVLTDLPGNSLYSSAPLTQRAVILCPQNAIRRTRIVGFKEPPEVILPKEELQNQINITEENIERGERLLESIFCTLQDHKGIRVNNPYYIKLLSLYDQLFERVEMLIGNLEAQKKALLEA